MDLLLTIKLSLFTFGVSALFDEGMIFEKLGSALVRTLGVWACKPLFLCPICMTSVYSGLMSIYFLCMGYIWSVDDWLIIMLTTCGLNFILTRWLTK